MSVGKESIKRAANAGTRGRKNPAGKAESRPAEENKEMVIAPAAEAEENIQVQEVQEAKGQEAQKQEPQSNPADEKVEKPVKATPTRKSAASKTRTSKAVSSNKTKVSKALENKPKESQPKFIVKEEKKPGRAVRFTEDLPVHLL